MYWCLITCQSDKSASVIGVKLLVFFTFFINFFMKTLIKSTICCQTVPVERLLMLWKLCVSSFSAFVLNLSMSGNILFSHSNGNCLFSSASLVGELTGTYELRVMVSVELHVNARYAQHPALKLVNGKIQSVIGGKLFSSC